MRIVQPIKNEEDIRKIIEYLEKYKPLKYSIIFKLGIYSGLRVSDIVGLDIEDVKGKTHIEIFEQKTGKYKKFPVKEDLQADIEKYLKLREKEWSIDDFNPLFIGRKHCRLDRSQVYRVIVQACNVCNVTGNFGTHTMRKTFGYHHYKQFKDIALLQKIFNHSAPDITLRYIGIEQDKIDQSYSEFSYNFDENKSKQRKIYAEKHKVKYKDIENGLDYLFKLYQKIDKKLDKVLKILEI